MTTINFPSSPVLNQVYTFGSKSWFWNGSQWQAETPATPTLTLTPNLQTGTSYTLVISDAGKRVDMSNATANVLTVPPNSSVAFPSNTLIYVSQGGAGATTIAAGSGVTINTSEGLKVGGQYRMVSLLKTGTDTWLAIGTSA